MPYLVGVAFTGTSPTAVRYCLGSTDIVRIGRGRTPPHIRERTGRPPVLELRLPDRTVSSTHLSLARGRGRRWSIVDHRSKNGTRVNGATTRRRRLSDGDFIELGHHLLVFRHHDTPCQPTLMDRGSAWLTQPYALRTMNPTTEAALAELAHAPPRQPLLIRGEVGSGTAELARLAHTQSGRRGAFVPIVYGHLSSPLLRAAEGGTLFIEDVAALDLERQAELATMLHAGTRDIRVVAATSRDLRRACFNGHFRDDLYRQLCDHTVDVPPLRSRPEDIALLVRHFLYDTLEAQAISLHVCRCALHALLDYSWPGNAHQLRHALESASAVAESDIITVDQLPAVVRQSHRRCHAGVCAMRRRPDQR